MKSQPWRGFNSLFLVVCLLTTALFVFRQIPLTSDDEFYRDYFSAYREFGDELLSAIINEPLFTLFTNAFHLASSSPDFGLRVLILLSILPHLVVAYRLGGWRAWAYMTGYFLFVELAPHLSFVQLRQGLAVSMLMLFFNLGQGRWRPWGVAVLGLIHTSFLVLLPCFALASLKRSLAYVLIILLALVLMANPDLVGQWGFLLGRRESVYLGEVPTYSMAYVAYSLLLMAYVSYFARDGQNDDWLLTYHAMCALVLPMFFMTTLGAFAERLYFVVRCLELSIVVQSRRVLAARVAAGYIAMNVSYSIYHSFVNFGTDSGVLERYQLLLP